MTSEQEEIEDKTVVTINWRASKGVLSRTLATFYDSNRGEGSNFRLRTQMHGGYDLGEIIHDLGHGNRGFTDFPYQVDLEFPNSDKITGIRKITIETTISTLTSNLIRTIENYRSTSDKYRDKPDRFWRDIDVLTALSENFGKRKVIIELDSPKNLSKIITSFKIFLI